MKAAGSQSALHPTKDRLVKRCAHVDREREKECELLEKVMRMPII